MHLHTSHPRPQISQLYDRLLPLLPATPLQSTARALQVAASLSLLPDPIPSTLATHLLTNNHINTTNNTPTSHPTQLLTSIALTLSSLVTISTIHPTIIPHVRQCCHLLKDLLQEHTDEAGNDKQVLLSILRSLSRLKSEHRDYALASLCVGRLAVLPPVVDPLEACFALGFMGDMRTGSR